MLVLLGVIIQVGFKESNDIIVPMGINAVPHHIVQPLLLSLLSDSLSQKQSFTVLLSFFGCPWFGDEVKLQFFFFPLMLDNIHGLPRHLRPRRVAHRLTILVQPRHLGTTVVILKIEGGLAALQLPLK